MGQDLNQAGQKSIRTDIVYSGEKMILPDGMEIGEAINLLHERQEYLTTAVDMEETFDVFPWDGANAIAEVLTAKYGWAASAATQTWFGEIPPKLISIDIGYNKKKSVPWGQFTVPKVKGHLATSYAWSGPRLVFKLTASVQRKDEADIQDIFSRVRDYLRTNSIYRGKAIRIRFVDDKGADLKMPEPKFMEVGHVRPEDAIYSQEVQDAIQTNLYTPITRVLDLISNGIPVKRGVLLGGPFGTGKTLAAAASATLAVESGITYLYIPRADELAKAIEFAKQYQSPACVIFCEDIDRVLDGKRDAKMDDILNIIDGIESKNSHIITVLTTNELNRINAAMLRPGRLDAVIEVKAPDAKAVEKLIRLYGGDRITPDTDLAEAGLILQGNIPAVIAEVVKRAKLAELGRQVPGERVNLLSEGALVEAARTMQMQIQLLKDASAPKEAPITLDATTRVVVEQSMAPALAEIKQTQELFRKLADKVGVNL